MATKEENLNRLRQLAGLLGREADMSGSAADIAQRVSEWEEELAVSPEGIMHSDESGADQNHTDDGEQLNNTERLNMRDFQNAFDAALAGVDSTIVEVMGIRAQFTSGAQRGGEVQGVFDDPESLGFAGGGVRIEGSSPSLFVRTDTVRAVRRGDTLTINGEMFWVDRVSPDDGGSCYLWLNRGQPPAVNRRR
ncbi:TPA: head-tail joining protein [Escherichia coli]